MSITYTEVFTTNFGDGLLTCYSLTGDGATTTVAGTSIGLQDIRYAWFQSRTDSNGDANAISTSFTSGPVQAVEITAISGTNLLFAVGVEKIGIVGPAYA